VVAGAPGSRVGLGFFVPNVSGREAGSVLEIERLDELSTRVMALGLGRQIQATPMGRAVLSPAGLREIRPTLPPTEMPAAGIFRETLLAAPAKKDSHALTTSLHMLATPGQKRKPEAKSIPPKTQTPALAAKTGDKGDKGDKGDTKKALRIPAGKELQIALVADVAKNAIPGTAQVYRVVEKVGDRVTGGVTLVVETR